LSFNSFQFAIFFPLIFFALRFSQGWFKLGILILGNIIFLHVLGPKHSLLIVYIVFVSYLGGLLIELTKVHPARNLVFTFALTGLILGPLLYFKYFSFGLCLFELAEKECVATSYIETYSTILPLGISFYTLQALGYVFDVFYGATRSEKNFLHFASFKTFFPQLVAGPIERYNTLLPQFKKPFHATNADLHAGFALMAWGFFKKIVVADNLGLIVDPVFANPENFGADTIIIATLAFTVQIYCDFSGYVAIALGASRMLGIRLSVNFNNPYFASSITNFWRRWHITLSNWFRDYLYKPLGGSRRGNLRMYIGIAAVFIVSGVWHGANFTFVAWASIHLMFVMFEKIIGVKREDDLVKFNFLSLASWLSTILIVITAWIFFRAKNLDDAFLMILKIINAPVSFNWISSFGNELSAAQLPNLWIGFSAAIFVFFLEYLWGIKTYRDKVVIWIVQSKGAVWSFSLTLAILVLGNFGRSSFIYFQF
jgi:alginate O-acetyltransferase complex protein AlgI